MILLARHAGPSKLPLFPPPQCGSSNPTHALIICPEKLAGDKHPIMALHPVPSASFQITTLITKLFLLLLSSSSPSSFSFLSIFLPYPSWSPSFSIWCKHSWRSRLVLYHAKVRWSMLTDISWSQVSLVLWQMPLNFRLSFNALGAGPACLFFLSVRVE